MYLILNDAVINKIEPCKIFISVERIETRKEVICCVVFLTSVLSLLVNFPFKPSIPKLLLQQCSLV